MLTKEILVAAAKRAGKFVMFRVAPFMALVAVDQSIREYVKHKIFKKKDKSSAE